MPPIAIGLVKAEAPAEEALKQAEKSPQDFHGQAEAMTNLGNIYRQRGELDQAEEFHQRAIPLYKQIDNSHGVAKSLNNLGIVHWQRGELDQTEDYYQRSLTLAVPRFLCETDFIDSTSDFTLLKLLETSQERELVACSHCWEF